MGTGDVIALVSALVAAVSAVVSFSQARSAKRAAKSADRQADAVERQTELMRQSFVAERDAASDAAGPTFRIVEAELLRENENYVTATIQMDSGPALESVIITARGPELRSLTRSVGDLNILQSIRWDDVSAGGQITVTAWIEFELTNDKVSLTLDLQCGERGSQRSWQRSIMASAEDKQGVESDAPWWRR